MTRRVLALFAIVTSIVFFIQPAGAEDQAETSGEHLYLVLYADGTSSLLCVNESTPSTRFLFPRDPEANLKGSRRESGKFIMIDFAVKKIEMKIDEYDNEGWQ